MAERYFYAHLLPSFVLASEIPSHSTEEKQLKSRFLTPSDLPSDFPLT
jgi:hypothetical protein